MSSIQFKIYPAPQALQADVECFRLCRYEGNEALAIKVSLNGTPGLVFQQPKASPTIKNITALSGRHTGPTPTLFVYGQNTERTVIQMAEGPFTMLQVIFKPHGLNTLLGLKASELTNSSLQLNQLVGLDLYS
ncbi:MAG TPA: DUF6597 domain-containing transcriptional factor, partial [Chloroflexia bacterium]|nr:DUF6597 domain-containing transcriptional factor [Chloroflexia bacterium]